ncbi:MAG: hypothetical protein PVF49_05015 [Anaerolineales bacterium]
MLGLGLKQVKEALDRKADSIQRQFIEMGEELEDLNRQILESEGDARNQLKEEHKALRQEQLLLAEEINVWRERARAATNQPTNTSIRAFLDELETLEDESLQPAIEYANRVLDDPEAEFLAQAEGQEAKEQTAAGRLLERARYEYDMRSSDLSYRQREAINFANRPGTAQNDDLLAEMEAGLNDPDPIVRELALLTTIQLHRFRALRLADLERAHQSVQFLARLKDPQAIPVLVEIVENQVTDSPDQADSEFSNMKTRMVALLKLVEWHTPEAHQAVYQRQFDRDKHITKAAKRALELFPEKWTGPIKK